MNNRSTLIPTKQPNKANLSSSNKPELSRARNSIAGQFNYPRSTMLTSGKQNDPRPISDAKFKEENITKIFDFLIQESYTKNISKKTITSPTSKEFYFMFEFIFKKIRPEYADPISEENIFVILNELKYPGVLAKNHLYAIGAPNTAPYLIAVLSWLIDLVNYVLLMCENVKGGGIGEKGEEAEEVIEEEQVINAYVLKAYRASNIDEVREQFRNELLLKTEINMNEKAEIDKALNDLSNEISLLRESSKALKAMSTQHQNGLSLLQKAKEGLSQREADLLSMQKAISDKMALYETKNAKAVQTKKDLEAIEQTVKTQPVTMDDYTKMTEHKQSLDLSYEALSKRKEDTTERFNQFKKKMTEHKQKLIQSQVNTFDRHSIKNLDIEKYITQCLSSIDYNEIKAELSRSNAVLIQNVNMLIADNKEKEKAMLGMQTETLHVEDRIKDSKLKLNQKENEFKAKEAEINNEKSKGNSFVDAYSEDFTKTNDAIQKAKSDIIGKEKMIDQMAQKEKDLAELYGKSEIETEEYINELEKEYNDTLIQLEKMKIENIQLIRKNYKALEAVFNDMKKEIEQKDM